MRSGQEGRLSLRKWLRGKSLLCVPPNVTFPDNTLLKDLANNFGYFFLQTIDGINKSLDALQSPKTLDCAIAEGDCACAVDECSCVVQSESPACATFSEFRLLSQDQVAELVRRAAAKSCPLDPRPTSVVLQVHDLLATGVYMINSSFEAGQFAENWREALISPC